jgi:hypothetical protein
MKTNFVWMIELWDKGWWPTFDVSFSRQEGRANLAHWREDKAGRVRLVKYVAMPRIGGGA